jgi:undecaprenyl diphosphate synthase
MLSLLRIRDLLDHYKASVHILGKTRLLKPDVLTQFLQVQDMTRNNRGAILNVCCPYTSREEMTHSLREIVTAVEIGELDVEDIDEGTIEQNLYTKDCPRPDLLIRTSGVKRLSDFLLWQVMLPPPSLFVMLMDSVIRIRRSNLWIVIGLNSRFGSSLLCYWIIRFPFYGKE